MVFENAHTVPIDIESQLGAIEVADLFREAPEPTRTGEAVQHTYRFECQEGEISQSHSVRQAPVLLQGQTLSLHQRNRVSFRRSATLET